MANKPQVNLNFVKGYGDNFKKLREMKGLTQKQLYNELHISDKSISLIEKEQREPTIEQINIYSEYFDASLDYLTGRTKIANPTIQVINDYTGLSEEVIDILIKTKEENKAYWYGDIINSLLANKHFNSIVIALTDLATSNNPDCKIEGLSYQITRKELLETILNKQFALMIDSIIEEYKKRQENDCRIAYQILLDMYRDEKLTYEQYQQTIKEYDKGNFDFVPDGYIVNGGADNGKHQGKQK